MIGKDKSEYLWRYMDLAKFIDLLVSKTLFLPLASFFEDKREGLHFLPQMAELDHLLRKFNGGHIGDPNESLRQKNQVQEKMRERILISCWNRSPVESVALWKMYTAGHNGVCIRTDIKALRSQIEPKLDRVFFGDVKYGEVQKSENALDAFFKKSFEYAFESEFRAVAEITDENLISNLNEKPAFFMSNQKYGGLPVSVDLAVLLKEVRVHYQAPGWLTEDIRKLVELFGLRPGLVASSRLRDEV